MLTVNVSFSQQDTVYQQVVKDVIVDTLSLKSMKNDTIQTDSIASDSIKSNIISPDAIDQVIDYSSKDSILFSMTEEKMFLYGIGELSATDMNLKSSYVEISTEDSYLFSKSIKDSLSIVKPILKQGEESFTVDSIKYNFKSKRALVLGAKMKQDEGFFLHTEIGKKQTNGEFHIKNGKFTTCNLDHPHYYIRLSKAIKIPDKHIISGPMNFYIADIPLPIGLPFGLLPNPKSNSSGILIPEYGEDNNRGFFLRNGGYYQVFSDKFDAALTGEVYTKGGWGLTLNTNYRKLYKYSGRLNLSYSKHQNGEKELPNSVTLTTFWARGSYRRDAKANPNSNFSVNLDFGKSEHTALNSKNINEAISTQKSSNISYSWAKPGSILNFSANFGVNQNTKTHSVNLNLPTISLNVKKQFPFKQIGTGGSKWYQKIGFSVNVNAKNSVSTGDSTLFTESTFNKMKNGLKYSIPISTSFKLLEFINVSPTISYTGRLYSKYLIERNILYVDNDELKEGITNDTINKLSHPFNFSFSVPFSTKIYGTFNINKGRFKALRHVMSPSVSYNYRPDFEKEFWGFYGYNPEDKATPYYSHYDKFVYGSPPTGKSGAVSFSLGNTFEMKMKNKNDTIEQDKKIKILESLNINTSYNLAVDSLNLSPIRVSGSTRFFKNFSARFTANFEPYILNEDGKKINTYEFVKNRRLARFTNASISFSGSLKPKKDKDKSNENTNIETPFYYFSNPEIPYADFDIPWNLSLSYNFVLRKKFIKKTQSFETDKTQTANLNGSFSLTENWKITASSRYDFSAKKFVSVNVSVHRDLHCWEMSFNVIPFGSHKSYTFRINIKSSVMKDLKYEKRKNVDKTPFYN